MSICLVTGAAGFIGSHTCAALLARGDTVVGLDNLNDYYAPERKQSNVREIEALHSTGQFTFVAGDIREVDTVSTLFTENDFDAVIHLAAMAGVRASIENPALYYSVNVDGTRVLLDAAARIGENAQAPIFVLASTSSVYGKTQRIPFEEGDPCDRPLVPYSASKRAAEMMGFSYHNMFELDINVLRFFTVYGPRGRPDMMAYKVADSIRNGDEVPLYNGGQMYRDWTYVKDTVSGIVAAADHRLGYEVFNLGRGESVLLSDFIKLVEGRFGRQALLRPSNMPLGDVPRTAANIDKARRILGYDPQVGVSEGVEAFADWYESVHS